MAEINIEIDERELENRSSHVFGPRQSIEQFSLRRAILAQMNKTEQRDSEAAVIEEATKLHRSVAATTEDSGELIIPLSYAKRAAYTAATEKATGVVIDEEQQELLLPLESNLVLSQAGVRMMTGLVGNIYWPEHSATKVFGKVRMRRQKMVPGCLKRQSVYS